MEWTAAQIAEMRKGRPVYGDSSAGIALTWLRTSKETGGEYGLIYGEASPGSSVFPHYHTTYTETTMVFEGSLDGRAGDQAVNLKAGDEVVVPPRMAHGWDTSQEGFTRIIVELRPAHEGFEKWVMMLQNMKADGLTKADLQPKSLVHAALLVSESDTNPAGRARALNPDLKSVAWFARKAGVERRLEEKYFQPRKGDVAAT